MEEPVMRGGDTGTWAGYRALLAEGFLEEAVFAARVPLIFSSCNFPTAWIFLFMM